MSLALDLRKEYILYHLWKSKVRVYLRLYLYNSKCRNNFVLVRFLVAHIRSNLQFTWTERESTGKILVGHRMVAEAEWQAPGSRQEPMEVSQQETQPKTWHRNITHGHRHCCECSLRAPVSSRHHPSIAIFPCWSILLAEPGSRTGTIWPPWASAAGRDPPFKTFQKWNSN